MTEPESTTSLAPAIEPPFEKTGALRHPLTAWIVLIVCCAATFIGWSVSRSQLLDQDFDRFQIRVGQITNEVSQRVLSYEQALVAARASLTANQPANGDSWRTFVDQMDIDRSYPGISGIGFIANVPATDLPAFVAANRRDDTPEFAVRPEGQRPDYFPIQFIEPQERNLALIGYDIGSDSLRRAMAEESRDNGEATLTPRRKRANDPIGNSAVLFLLPVYKSGLVVDSINARRAALLGWVFVPFRIDDVMAGVIPFDLADVNFEIFDGKMPSALNLLYDDDRSSGNRDARYKSVFKKDETLKIGGRTWTIHFTTRPVFDKISDRSKHIFILIGGLSISLLIFGITRSLATTRARAFELAEKMTEQLRIQERALTSSNAGVVITDALRPDNPVIYVNPAMEKISGYSAAEFIGRNCRFLQGKERNQPALEQLRHALKEKSSCKVVLRNFRKAGKLFCNELSISPVRDEEGQVTNFVGIVEDITERENAVAQIPATGLGNERSLRSFAVRLSLAR